jgi:low affinity Fe/Cu permease
VVTFLIVFSLQYTQNRDTRAIQLKLDEILRGEAHTRDQRKKGLSGRRARRVLRCQLRNEVNTERTLDAATSTRTTARVSLRVNSYSTTRTTRDASSERDDNLLPAVCPAARNRFAPRLK